MAKSDKHTVQNRAHVHTHLRTQFTTWQTLGATLLVQEFHKVGCAPPPLVLQYTETMSEAAR